MDYVELLFAAKVRALAQSLRSDEYHEVFLRFRETDKGDPSKMRAEWMLNHPLSEFVPRSLASLQEVAAQIRTIKQDV